DGAGEPGRGAPYASRPSIKKDYPMTDALKVGFAPFSAQAKGVLVLFCNDELKFGAAARKALGAAAELVTRAAAADRFTGKAGTTLDLVAPTGLSATRLTVVGTGKEEGKPRDFVKLGGAVMGKLPASATEALIMAELPGAPLRPEQAADLGFG